LENIRKKSKNNFKWGEKTEKNKNNRNSERPEGNLLLKNRLLSALEEIEKLEKIAF